MEEFPLDKYLPKDLLENRTEFRRVLHAWASKLEPGTVKMEESQDEEGVYVVDFRPTNAAACTVGVIYYGSPKGDIFLRRWHDVHIFVGMKEMLPLSRVSLSLEPLISLLEAARKGHISISCWPLHRRVEIRSLTRCRYYVNSICPGIDHLYSLVVWLFHIKPKRVITYEPWNRTEIGLREKKTLTAHHDEN